MRTAIDQFFQLFNANIPDERSARENITTWIAESGLRCRTCGDRNLFHSDNERTRLCSACNKPTWVTADSYFRKAKSVRTHLCAILITQAGIEISDAELARRLKVAQSTAWCAMRKVGLVIAHTFSDVVNVVSANFQALVRKRSRLTPVGARPSAEELAMSATEPGHKFSVRDYILEKQDGIVDGVEDQVRVFDKLSEKPIQFDVLFTTLDMEPGDLTVALCMLELMGLAENVNASYWKRKASLVVVNEAADPQEDIASLMANIWNKITVAHGGVSRKYLQLHISSGVFHDAARIPQHSLLDTCMAFGQVSMRELEAFVSPRMLSIPRCIQNTQISN